MVKKRICCTNKNFKPSENYGLKVWKVQRVMKPG